MIVKNIEEYDKKTHNKETPICDSLEESFDKIIDVGFIPEFIICDAIHKMMLRAEIKYFSVPDKIVNVSESFTIIMFNGHKVKVITKVEQGEDAFKGIELYGRIKSD